MSNPVAKKSWSPYLVGVGIGVLSWFAFWSADHPLGITTAFEHTSALVLKAAVPALAESNSYYQEEKHGNVTAQATGNLSTLRAR